MYRRFTADVPPMTADVPPMYRRFTADVPPMYHPCTTEYRRFTTHYPRLPPIFHRLPLIYLRTPPIYHRLPPIDHRAQSIYHRLPPIHHRLPPKILRKSLGILRCGPCVSATAPECSRLQPLPMDFGSPRLLQYDSKRPFFPYHFSDALWDRFLMDLGSIFPPKLAPKNHRNPFKIHAKRHSILDFKF